MIPNEVKPLFQFIDFLHSNIENFKRYNDIMKDLHKLRAEKLKKYPDRMRTDESEAEYEFIHNQILKKSDVIIESVLDVMEAKVRELNLFDWENPSTLYDNYINHVSEFLKNADRSDRKELRRYAVKYDKYTKELPFDYFKPLLFEKFHFISEALLDKFIPKGQPQIDESLPQFQNNNRKENLSESEKYEQAIRIKRKATKQDIEQFERMGAKGFAEGQEISFLPEPKNKKELFEQFEKLYAQRYFETLQSIFIEKYGEATEKIIKDELTELNRFINKAIQLSTTVTFNNKWVKPEESDLYEYSRLVNGYYDNPKLKFYPDIHIYYNTNAVQVYAKYFLYNNWLENKLNDIHLKQVDISILFRILKNHIDKYLKSGNFDITVSEREADNHQRINKRNNAERINNTLKRINSLLKSSVNKISKNFATEINEALKAIEENGISQRSEVFVEYEKLKNHVNKSVVITLESKLQKLKKEITFSPIDDSQKKQAIEDISDFWINDLKIFIENPVRYYLKLTDKKIKELEIEKGSKLEQNTVEIRTIFMVLNTYESLLRTFEQTLGFQFCNSIFLRLFQNIKQIISEIESNISNQTVKIDKPEIKHLIDWLNRNNEYYNNRLLTSLSDKNSLNHTPSPILSSPIHKLKLRNKPSELDDYEHYLKTTRTPFTCGRIPSFTDKSKFKDDKIKYDLKFEGFKSIIINIESKDEINILINDTIDLIEKFIKRTGTTNYKEYFQNLKTKIQNLKGLSSQINEDIDWISLFNEIDIDKEFKPKAYITTTIEQQRNFYSKASFSTTMQYMHNLKKETYLFDIKRKLDYLNALDIQKPKTVNTESPLFNQTVFEAQNNYYEFLRLYKKTLESTLPPRQIDSEKLEQKKEIQTITSFMKPPNAEKEFDKLRQNIRTDNTILKQYQIVIRLIADYKIEINRPHTYPQFYSEMLNFLETEAEVLKKCLEAGKEYSSELGSVKEDNEAILKAVPSQTKKEALQETENDLVLANIEDWLYPFKEESVLSESNYKILVFALKQYFDIGTFPNIEKPISVRKINKKRFGWALNEIFRANKDNNEKLTIEYLKFAKHNISLFIDVTFDEDNILKSNLYKYFTTKTK